MMSERGRPAVRVITCDSVSASGADRWMKQYADRPREWKFPHGRTIGEMRDVLAKAEKTYEGLKGILHVSWLLPWCDCCREYAFAVIEFGDNSEALCITCAQTVVDVLSAFPRAAEKA